jgi:glycosyltransferase involved in cell wall biosynthesis
VVPTYLPATRYGGPIHSVHGLCKALADQGHDVHVYTTNVDGQGESPVPLGQPVQREGVSIIYFATGWLRRIYRAPAMAARLAKCVASFDLVHIHAMFLWPGLAASQAARQAGVPYVVSPRGMLVPELIARKSRLAKTAWLRLFDRRMLRDAAAVHVTSPVEAQDLQALGIATRRVLVIPNGIEVRESATQAVVRQPHLLYLGRLDRKKGIEVLLLTMALLPGVPLVIGGSGEAAYTAELQRLASTLGLDGRVEFLGHLDDAAKWREYRRASLFVLPSLSENFANVVLEAMAAGCPALVSPGVGLAETVARHECGRVVEREPPAIAAAVRELLDQPELRARMGKNGMAAARSFAWERVAGRMIDAYGELLTQAVAGNGRVRVAQ